MINHAVFSAYENLLEKGTFPFFLLFLDIDPHRVDVNIHPSKMEVKFDDEQAVYRFVAALVRKSLTSSEFIPSLGLTGSDGAKGETGLRFTPAQHEWPGGQQTAWAFPEREKVDPLTGEIIRLQPPSGTAAAARLLGGIDEMFRGRDAEHERPPLPRPAEGTPLWQLHAKYILAAVENGVMIIDQHVAHERVLYERALQRFASEARNSQQLLFPKTVELSAADYVLIEELHQDLEGLGFDITLLGRNSVAVQGVPTDVRVGGEEGILENVLSLYKEYRRDSPTAVRDNLAKSFSCRSAVKAGDPLTEQEMRALVADLFATRMPYVCPHGRPIVLRISIEEMDRRFGRL
jgi:DNA mismatch repair protein MutL